MVGGRSSGRLCCICGEALGITTFRDWRLQRLQKVPNVSTAKQWTTYIGQSFLGT